MQIAMHDKNIEPYLEESEGRHTLHVDIFTDVPAFLETVTNLDPGAREVLLKLWADPSVSRSYVKGQDFVLIGLAG